jgi:hypothetical protein
MSQDMKPTLLEMLREKLQESVEELLYECGHTNYGRDPNHPVYMSDHDDDDDAE